MAHGIHPTAAISADAQISDQCYIGAFVQIESGASVAENCEIHSHSIIGAGSQVGSGTIIQNGVYIGKESIVGSHCIVQSGAVIGSDGFGFAPDENGEYSEFGDLRKFVADSIINDVFNRFEFENFISQLENTIAERIEISKIAPELRRENQNSYVVSLFDKGINKIAQKVGEEAVEVVIEAKDNDDKLFLNESADLLFHYLMLLQAKGFKLNDVIAVLKEREK